MMERGQTSRVLLVAGKSVPSREPEIGSKQTIMCSNTVPPGFIWLVVVASIPTDREDPSGLAWQGGSPPKV